MNDNYYKPINECIKKSGLKKKHIALALNISPQGLNKKIKGESEFTATEIAKMKKLLGLNENRFLELFLPKENIFFAQNVDKKNEKQLNQQ